MNSLVIPVYKNEESLPELLDILVALDEELGRRLEVVFVVDGSPDGSATLLRERLPKLRFRSQLVILSRNYGSFAAIRAGLSAATGEFFAVMAADLQEPPDLVRRFFHILSTEPVDVTIGQRESRDDPLPSRWASRGFWAFYRRWVQRSMPPGGFDVFGCNRAFRDQLLALEESNTTLVGLVLWLGFRRKFVRYRRVPRRHGSSAWSLGRKLRYLSDSVFAFSDLPIRMLVVAGVLGLAFSVVFALVVLAARISGAIPVPGYAGTVILISFFAALNSLGLGVIGSYVWRAFENTKRRPDAVVMARYDFEGREN